MSTIQNKVVPEKNKPTTQGPPKKPQKIKDPKAAAEQRKLLAEFLREQWWLLLIGAPFMFLGSLTDFFFPSFIGKIIAAMQAYDQETITYYINYWVGTMIFAAVCAFLRDLLFGIASERLGQSLRQRLFEKVLRKDVQFFDENRTGEICSRISSDTQVVQDGLTTSFAQMIKSMCIMVGMIIIMFTYSWQLTIYALLLTVPNMVSMKVFFSIFNKYAEKYQKSKAQLSSVASECLGNIRTVKAFADERGSVIRYHAHNWETCNIGIGKSYYWAGFFFAVTCLRQWAFCAMMYIITILFYKIDGMDVGKLTTYLLYMNQLTGAFTEMTNQAQSLAKVIGSSYDIANLIIKEPKVKMAENGLQTNIPEGKINLENVSFRYPTKPDIKILDGVNIDIQSNKIVAFVGASGCGKSSVISLIERFYDPIDGNLFYNDVNLKDIDNVWYHQQQLAIVSQEPVLFSGSIRENILYGVQLKDLTPEEIQAKIDEAVSQANAKFVYDTTLFPQGFDTTVGERGVKLSGGQKQRIAIARALIRKPRVLLLDEATSALDAESEHQVQQALDQITESSGQTVVVIAHRLSTIRNAHKIVLIRKGVIAEQGTHDELIALGGAYHKLVERQLMTQNLGEKIVKNK